MRKSQTGSHPALLQPPASSDHPKQLLIPAPPLQEGLQPRLRVPLEGEEGRRPPQRLPYKPPILPNLLCPSLPSRRRMTSSRPASRHLKDSHCQTPIPTPPFPIPARIRLPARLQSFLTRKEGEGRPTSRSRTPPCSFLSLQKQGSNPLYQVLLQQLSWQAIKRICSTQLHLPFPNQTWMQQEMVQPKEAHLRASNRRHRHSDKRG